MINQAINELVDYGLKQGLLQPADTDFVVNQLLALLEVETFEREATRDDQGIEEILGVILNEAVRKNIVKHDTVDERDLFDAKVMGLLMPRPSEVNAEFEARYAQAPRKATDYFYQLSQASHYIRTARIKKDRRWKVMTAYGELDLTINLSKPEKDPKTIALAKSLPSSGYPKCVLCKENVGYAGNLNRPARQNHRVVPVTLVEEQWYLQYSPYVYYNEHCIVLKAEHEPMAISRLTFERLFAFVDRFNHYFVGSNADLPIVGGSILVHEHFQGGDYEFAMARAAVLRTFTIPKFDEVAAQLLHWPLTTLRLRGKEVVQLVDLATHILVAWRGYSDPLCGIYAMTNEQPHNTLTPIARLRDGYYELDLVLRNNRTSDEHPDGMFHPHQHYHHLKKENIGLIEVMGLAILPGRLVSELETLKQALVVADVEILVRADLKKHQPWFFELMERSAGLSEKEIETLIEQDVGLKFAEILACCGVYKLDDAGLAGVERFMERL